jgi:Tfp pilus assembly PilM family ATPase
LGSEVKNLKKKVSSLTDSGEEFEENIRKLNEDLAAVCESSQKKIDCQMAEVERFKKNVIEAVRRSLNTFTLGYEKGRNCTSTIFIESDFPLSSQIG